MSVTSEIVSSWRRPGQGLRRHLSRGVSEPFAFSLLLVFLIMAFVAQWPAASRDSYLADDGAVAPRILARGLAVLASIPLWYGLAAVSRLVARLLGGKGTWYGARLALFWALATVSPLVLFQGLIQGFLGAGPGATLAGVLVLAGFLYLWLAMLIEAER